MTALPNARPQVWVSLPLDGADRLRLDVGDSYLVRLSTGLVLWAVFVSSQTMRFDHESNGEATGEAIDGVEAVMVAGYGPGIAASIIAAAQKTNDLLGPKYLDREPIASSERDHRITRAR